MNILWLRGINTIKSMFHIKVLQCYAYNSYVNYCIVKIVRVEQEFVVSFHNPKNMTFT